MDYPLFEGTLLEALQQGWMVHDKHDKGYVIRKGNRDLLIKKLVQLKRETK